MKTGTKVVLFLGLAGIVVLFMKSKPGQAEPNGEQSRDVTVYLKNYPSGYERETWMFRVSDAFDDSKWIVKREDNHIADGYTITIPEDWQWPLRWEINVYYYEYVYVEPWGWTWRAVYLLIAHNYNPEVNPQNYVDEDIPGYGTWHFNYVTKNFEPSS